MDVAVVADRTGSMSATDINAMIAGIRSMLTKMTTAQQYVALATIGRAMTGAPATCLSKPSTSATAGPWVATGFFTDYLTSAGAVNSASNLVKAIDCLTQASGTGTHLSAPLKAAARYLLGLATNNLSSLPVRTGTIRKAIIFETDGQPNETISNASTTLTNATDPGGGTNGDTACSRFKEVATNAKSAGILIVTIAFNLGTDKCGTAAGSATVTSVLASAASPDSTGAASDADNACSTTALRATENSDGDYFFCAASGESLAAIFETALSTLSGSIKLIRFP
jgi:hypothetical protein